MKIMRLMMKVSLSLINLLNQRRESFEDNHNKMSTLMMFHNHQEKIRYRNKNLSTKPLNRTQLMKQWQMWLTTMKSKYP